MNCPACQQPMEPVPLEGTYRGAMTVDLCTACRGFWFDAGEQFRLTPAATLVLVRRVEASRDLPRQRVNSRLACPRCGLGLGVPYDLVRDDKYHYFRCPDRHGIFMPFFEFLRSQDLVRGLTPQEVDALRQKIVSVRCSSCGAPIDLQTQSKCASCGSSLSIVDLDQLGDALRQLDADARATTAPVTAPPVEPPDEVVARWRAARAQEETDTRGDVGQQIDLLDVGVSVLRQLLGRL